MNNNIKQKIIKLKKDTSKYTFKSNFVLLAIILVFSFLIGRLVFIMIFKGNDYSKMAEKQWKKVLPVSAKRGNIYDRNGILLATSINVYRVDLDLVSIRRYIEDEKTSMENVAEILSTTCSLDYNYTLDCLNRKNEDGSEASYSPLIRGIEKSIADSVNELKIYGVITSSDTKRYYPNNNSLSQTLGTVNYDGIGSTGLELYYDDYLAGKPGEQILGTDGNMEELPFMKSNITEPENGKDITSTIDANIQFYAEKVAEKGLLEHKAKKVSIMITDPNTGEILALVNKPDFNPNNPYEGFEQFEGETESEKLQSMWKNSAISDSFEPGSTFKVITMATAIEEGLVNENTTFNCEGGIHFGDVYVKCWNTGGHGYQTLSDILKNSCNVGFMALGEMIGKEKLNSYIKKLGFGDYTNIDLPGETTGIVKSTEDMADIDLGTIAFGQTNSVTIPQLLRAFNAIANGGNLIDLKIISEVSHTDDNGTIIVDDIINKKTQENVFSEETCALVRKFLEATALQGGDPNTFVDGYSIGIKTGTGEKIDPINGGYSDTKYLASIIGLSPVDNPKVSIYLSVDEPSTGIYYGGQVATPLAKILFKDLLSYMDSYLSQENKVLGNNIMIPEVRELTLEEGKKILEDLGLKVNCEGRGNIINDISIIPGTIVKKNSEITIKNDLLSLNKNNLKMPNLIGMSQDQAMEILDKLKIKYKFKGTGYVIYQSIDKFAIFENTDELIIGLE